MTTKKDNWRGHPIKEKEVFNVVKEILKANSIVDADEVKRIYEIVYNQKSDY